MARDKVELILYAGMIALWALFVAALIALLITAIIWIWRHMICSLLGWLIALTVGLFSAE